MKALKSKLKLISLILFGNHTRWIFIGLNEKQFIQHLKGEDVDMEIQYFRMRKYSALAIVKNTGESIDQDELILLKAKYQFDIDEFIARESKR